MLVAQSCPTLWNPLDCSPPCSSVHGILQTRILEWVDIPFWRSSQSRDRTPVSCIAGSFSTVWATSGAHSTLGSLQIKYTFVAFPETIDIWAFFPLRKCFQIIFNFWLPFQLLGTWKFLLCWLLISKGGSLCAIVIFWMMF